MVITPFLCNSEYTFFFASLKSEWNTDLKVSLEIIIVSASVQMIQGKWLAEVFKFRGI